MLDETLKYNRTHQQTIAFSIEALSVKGMVIDKVSPFTKAVIDVNTCCVSIETIFKKLPLKPQLNILLSFINASLITGLS
jgi:hypothetical protein